jgi:hypothetical protein
LPSRAATDAAEISNHSSIVALKHSGDRKLETKEREDVPKVVCDPLQPEQVYDPVVYIPPVQLGKSPKIPTDS